MSRLLTILAIVITLGPSYGQQGPYPLGKIRLTSGTLLQGTIEEMGADAVVFRSTNGQRLRIPNDKIRKITLDKSRLISAALPLFDIHLTDGSTILAVSPNEGSLELNFRTQSGDSLTLAYDQIRSFERAGIGQRTTPQKAGGKFFHWMEFGGLFGGKSSGETTTAFSVHTINGYRLWDFLEPGLGVSFDFYDDFTTLPVYLSARADLVKARVVPYYFGGVGYGFVWQNSNSPIDFDQVQGGITWSAGMGIKIPLEKISVVVSAGYKHQKITTLIGSIEEMGFETEENRKIRRFTLTTGITF